MVRKLVFPEALRRELIDHARAGEPDEVCGMLAGRAARVERVFPVHNTADEVTADSGVFRDRATGVAAPGRRAVHYYMDPRDQLRVYNAIDELGFDLIGYYHSHTHTEARPSPTDVRLATDLTSFYVLVSLSDDRHPPVRAWRITKTDPMDESGEVTEVDLD
ncbi:MAG: M67 family metallopeptidase [Chloroflexi bacterium]|nr:M67 family metallopeptidase [Chloroflexota bacterium]